jgi:hypothetical protein
MELVSTFNLGDSRESSDRGHQPSPQGKRHATRRIASPANRALVDKPARPAPNGRKQLTESAVLVGGAAARSEDASFEEF